MGIKNIEDKTKKIFSKREIAPPMGLWGTIESTLDKAAKRKRVAFLKKTSIAAAVLLLIASGATFIMHQSSDKELYLNKKLANVKESKPKDLDKHNENIDQIEHKADTTANDIVTLKSESKNLYSKKNTTFDNEVHGSTRIINELPITFIDITEIDENDFYYIDLLFNTNKIDNQRAKMPLLASVPVPQIEINNKTTNKSKWNIRGYGGRTYISYIASGNRAKGNAMYRQESIEVTREQLIKPQGSYGFDVSYCATGAFSIHTGLAMNKFTTTISPRKDETTILSNNFSTSNIFGELLFTRETERALNSVPMYELQAGDIIQQFSWIEIPITGSYTVTKGAVSFGFRTGIGGNVLASNDVIVENENIKKKVGTTDGLQKIYLSGMLGIDVTYSITQNFSLSFNPLYRHSLQPVSTWGIVRPYLVNMGIYSGLRYNF